MRSQEIKIDILNWIISILQNKVEAKRRGLGDLQN